MFEVFDLSRDLPCLQAGLAHAASLQEPVDLRVEDLELVPLLAELVREGSVTEDLGQGTPVVKPGDFFTEDVKLAMRPHE